MKKIRIKLTEKEYNLLNYITRKTKTDCWFILDKDKENFDCVYDLENKRKVTLRFAIQQLNEAIIHPYFLFMFILGFSLSNVVKKLLKSLLWY